MNTLPPNASSSPKRGMISSASNLLAADESASLTLVAPVRRTTSARTVLIRSAYASPPIIAKPCSEQRMLTESRGSIIDMSTLSSAAWAALRTGVMSSP